MRKLPFGARVALMLGLLASSFVSAVAAGQEQDATVDAPAIRSKSESIARGKQFLVSLFDPALDLLPEFRGSKTYWLFHDNYLAAHTLAGTNPEISRRIR